MCWARIAFLVLSWFIPLQKDNNGTLFEGGRITKRDIEVLQNGSLSDPELMHGIRPRFWCQV